MLGIDLNKHILDSEEAAMLHNISLYKAIADRYKDLSLGLTHQRG